MNKQEFRMKDKHRSFKPQKAPVIDKPDTSLSGANLTDEPKTDSESLSKATEVKSTDRLALIFGIGISALTMAAIYLSGAK